MAKEHVKKRKRKREPETPEPPAPSPSLLEVIGADTLRRIAGVVLFVFAIVLALAALGMAGVAGVDMFKAFYAIVGVGYYLLPIMFTAWAYSLVTARYKNSPLGPMRAFGAGLFFIAALAVVGALSPQHAGYLGTLVADPMVNYLDKVATLVILAGLVIVSLLLLFDTELWLTLFRRAAELVGARRAVPTTDEEGQPAPAGADAATVESTPDETAAVEPQTDHEASSAADEPADDEDTYVEQPEPDPRPTPARERQKPAYVPPTPYIAPPLSLLEYDRGKPNVGDTKARANIIRKTLQHFKIPVEMDEITVGPTVTQYALKPAAGVRLSKIVSLQSNIELALAASPIRIEAPIPGKSLVGIEVPNTAKATVGLGGLLGASEFTDAAAPLMVALGKDIAGSAHYANIAKMPHLLVAGTTGSGKSVMIHSIIASLLYRNSPEMLRFIMVDPKRVELTLYNGIPHLWTPVITDAKRCIHALQFAAKEMDRRYDILQEHRVQDISGYHTDVVAPAHAAAEKEKAKGVDTADLHLPDPLPYIVIIIDELADIMSAYPRDLESAIVRLAQMSRAVGIHLILATQRPSVNVITGLIKANIPSRIALKVASLVDSRTILDQPGAEKLLGAGDMLFLSGDMPKPRRIQSPFLTTGEVKKLTAFLKEHNDNYLFEAGLDVSNGEGGAGNSAIPFDEMEQNEDLDDLYEDVRGFVTMEQKASTSLIQRRFKVGYGRAARIMDQLEQRGVIEPSDGTNRPRRVRGAADAPENVDTTEDHDEDN